MKIKVKKVYDNKSPQAVFDSLKFRHVTFGESEKECYDMSRIGWLDSLSKDPLSSYPYLIQRFGSFCFMGELEIESDEPKVYHAANAEAAEKFINKQVKYFTHKGEWHTAYLKNIWQKDLAANPFFITTEFDRTWVSLIRECDQSKKTYSIEEAQKLLSEKLGEDVRIEK